MSKMNSLTLFTASLLAATVLSVPSTPSVAQERPAISTEVSAQQQEQQNKKGQQRKAAPAQRRAQPRGTAPRKTAPRRAAAPRRARPRAAAPQRTAPRRSAPRRAVAPHRAVPRTVTRPRAAPRVVRQPKTAPRAVRQPKAPRRTVASPGAAPRVVTPRSTKTVTSARLRGLPARGAGRAVIGGHRYSAWRSGYRVRRGGNWRTFVGLSALGAILIGANHYYPYAYISAPEPYCEGLTRDGCQLVWQEVQTVEGDLIDQCVAYCPWQ